MIQDLGKGMEKMQEMFTKDLEGLKNKRTEMSNTLEGINSRITEAEEQIRDLEDTMVEITAAKQNAEKRMRKKKDEDSLRDLQDVKCTNICIIGVLVKEREKGSEKIFEDIIAEKLPNIRNSQPNPGRAESLRKDKPKEEHTETHSNQNDKH